MRAIDANALKERVNRTIDYAVDEFDKGYNIGIQKLDILFRVQDMWEIESEVEE